jgi:putative FmdB family regulatory protein
LGGFVPTYEYACTECGDRLEVVQRFSDDPLSVCAACGGRLRKVFSPVGIVFKGSGFYRTDSRSSTATAGANGNGKAGADGAESKSETPAKAESGAKAESKSAGSSDSGTGRSETASASKGKSGTGSKVA